MGRAAVGYAVEGRSDEMVTLLRKDGPAYECTVGVAPLEAVAGVHRRLPEGYVDATAGVVTGPSSNTPATVGSPLPRYARLEAGL